jgi:hypothetical protein
MGAPKMLLVEGRTDADALRSLLIETFGKIICDVYRDNQPSQPNVVYVSAPSSSPTIGGYQYLRDNIRVWLEDSVIRQLGIVIDADNNLTGKWQSIRDALRGAGVNTLLGNTPLPVEGWMTEVEIGAKVMQIGVWVMPDNTNRGAIETFLTHLIPPNDALWNHSETIIRELPEQRFTIAKRDKARLYSWLAWQKQPGLGFGAAIQQKYFRVNLPTRPADTWLDWCRRLFDLP